MTRKVALIGSRSFPLTTPVGAQVVDTMREYGTDVVFLTRGSAGFDQYAAAVAVTLGLRCFAYPGHGGVDNFVRDAELVADCDEMVAFLDPDVLDKPYTGTAMVIERALAAGKPVRVATTVNDSLVWADA